MSNVKYRILIITIIAALVAALIDSMNDTIESIVTLKIYLGIYLSYLSAEFYIHFEEVKAFLENPLKGINSMSSISHLDEDLFFARFKTILKYEAKIHVRMSYMHDAPPKPYNKTSQEEYRKAIKEIVEKKEKVRFEYVILLSDANKEWIKERINEFKGLKNYNLHVYENNSNMIPPISIQCIDMKYVFLLALESEKRIIQERDVLIKDEKLVDKFNHYHTRILKNSISIITDGDLEEDNIKRLELG